MARRAAVGRREAAARLEPGEALRGRGHPALTGAGAGAAVALGIGRAGGIGPRGRSSVVAVAATIRSPFTMPK